MRSIPHVDDSGGNHVVVRHGRRGIPVDRITTADVCGDLLAGCERGHQRRVDLVVLAGIDRDEEPVGHRAERRDDLRQEGLGYRD